MRSRPLHALAVIALATILTGCAVTSMEVLPPDALTAVTAWPVSGRQGWMPGRKLRFGDYVTRDLTKRQETKQVACPNGCSGVDLGIYRRHFDEAFRTATQRMHYTLAGPAGAEVDVQLITQIDQQRRDWITRWLGMPTEAGGDVSRQIAVIGTLRTADDRQPPWRFALRDGASNGAALQGWAEDEHGRRLVLTPLRKVAGRQAGLPLQAPATMTLGYAFELDGRTVGAVSTVGPGQVWIDPDAAPDLRLSVAGLASALLLQSPLMR
ncbi:hypothetical protein [Roseateles sp.]|uniref:hypothetical protein n=1 Tax=Roseateles sp. TaxID=1971397 RepID=UPI003BA9AB10